MHDHRSLKRAERLALAVAAAVAAFAVLAAALTPFAVDGASPYFGSDARSLAVVERCSSLPPRAARHDCLRQVAAARAAQATGALALADARP